MVVKREGTPEDAGSFLSDVFQQTDNHLNLFQSLQTLASDIVNQQGTFYVNARETKTLLLLGTQMQASCATY